MVMKKIDLYGTKFSFLAPPLPKVWNNGRCDHVTHFFVRKKRTYSLKLSILKPFSLKNWLFGALKCILHYF